MKRIVWIMMNLGLLAACSQPAKQSAVVHAEMAGVISPQSTIFWETSAKMLDDKGDPDAALLTADDWAKLASSAAAMKAAALKLADAADLAAAAPGVKIQNEGTQGGASAAQVQKYIDADHPGFADHARKLAALADNGLTAANARDVTKLSAASDALDAVCEACHQKYWYPEQAG